MFMPEAFEIPIDHFVGERQRRVHGRDLRLQDAHPPEVSGLPGHRFIQADETAGRARDGLFSGMGHRLPMKIDASGKVKDPLGRGCDESRQVNRWHFLINRCWIDWIVPFSTEKIIPKPKGVS
jgi:hypothetical protein